MMEPSRPELSRPFPADRLTPAGLTVVVEANAAECHALAHRLMIPSLAALRCEWRLRSRVGGQFEAEGSLRARLHQVCVVTLDEFATDIVEEFSVVFVPSGAESDGADDPDEPDEIPFEAGVLDLGEATVEQLALALEPYPRKPGAELPRADVGQGDSQWAALAKWRTPH